MAADFYGRHYHQWRALADRRSTEPDSGRRVCLDRLGLQDSWSVAAIGAGRDSVEML